MIPEELIELVLNELEKADFDKELSLFKTNYPVLYAYLLNDQLEALSEDEFQVLFFDALVIVKCFEKAGKIPASIDGKMLEQLESSNWNLLHNTKPVNFFEKLDVFFKDSKQEDLLAFIEDSLAEDEDQIIGSAAREILFVNLKSIIDLLDENS